MYHQACKVQFVPLQVQPDFFRTVLAWLFDVSICQKNKGKFKRKRFIVSSRLICSLMTSIKMSDENFFISSSAWLNLSWRFPVWLKRRIGKDLILVWTRLCCPLPLFHWLSGNHSFWVDVNLQPVVSHKARVCLFFRPKRMSFWAL